MTARAMTKTGSPDLAESEKSDLTVARAVLITEADGIRALAEGLDDSFIDAVAILAGVSDEKGGRQTPGRVVICGMGKSGHVGRKIAATLASTGTPAQFVHPAEASHGDLGMITERDAVIAISNSGETHELSDLVAHLKRFRIPLVAITGQGDSTLAKAADIALVLPDCPEAGAIGLAPTTSTTMTLALGDALAVALLERKGFTARDFRMLHPGGKLGRQLSRITEFMHDGDNMPLVSEASRMSDAMLVMTSKHFGCTGVVDASGMLIGIITDGDLRRHMSKDLVELPVTKVMTRSPVTISPDRLAVDVLTLMNSSAQPFTVAFIVDVNKHPLGIVHLHDLLRAGVA